MFRSCLTAALTVLATPVLAADFHVAAPVTAVTLYPDTARVTHGISVDLPAGRHRLLMTSKGLDTSQMPRIEAPSGLTIGAISLLPAIGQDPAPLFTPAQAEARGRVDTLENQVQAQRDAMTAARAELAALKARLGFVTSIRASDTGSDAAGLIALADLVQTQSAQIAAQIAAAEQAMRPMEEQLEELTQQLATAQEALDQLAPPAPGDDLLAIEVIAATPVQSELMFETTAWAGWTPFYALHEGNDGNLTLDRKVMIRANDNVWHDVALTLSTVAPDGQVAPAGLYPDLARIHDPFVPFMEADSRAPIAMMVGAAPRTNAQANFDGVAVTYDYPERVSVMGQAILSLDQIALSGTTEIHAVPERDDTAFMVAKVTNDSAEPLLPGTMQIYRHGQYLGDAAFPLIPAGAEETLPLGPVEGLRLTHVVARNQTGDTGLISKSNTRRQEMRFAVQNLTGAPQDLTVFYALPFSEQEDLEVSLTLSQRPDDRDIDDKRGVAAWKMRLAPGEEKAVSITASFDWPEGQELEWQP